MSEPRYLTHKQLVDILARKVAADWEDIGRELLQANDVRNHIGENAAGCQRLLYKALESWLNSGGATMDQLVEAVLSPSVGPNQLVADKLKGLGLGPALTIDHIGKLRVAVADLAAVWDLLGTQLGVNPHELKEYVPVSSPTESQRCLSSLLHYWMTNCDPTIKKLAEVLESPIIKQKGLAMDLRRDYGGHTLVVSVPANSGATIPDKETQEEHTPPEEQMEMEELAPLQQRIEEVQTQRAHDQYWTFVVGVAILAVVGLVAFYKITDKIGDTAETIGSAARDVQATVEEVKSTTSMEVVKAGLMSWWSKMMGNN